MPTEISGQPTSAEVIDRLKRSKKPVILAFSRGKDSIAAFLALADAGIDVRPVFLYHPQGVPFVDDSLSKLSKSLGTKIYAYPHPGFLNLLGTTMFQPPHRMPINEQTFKYKYSYENIWDMVKTDLGLDNHTYIADGVRAADSIVRRASFVRNGVIKERACKVSPIADWLKGEVLERIKAHGVELPIDYELFGRSFDGLDFRFTHPLKKALPQDFEVVKFWFPLIEADIYRHEYYPKAFSKLGDDDSATYIGRAKNEQARYKQAVDGQFLLTICFCSEREKAEFLDRLNLVPDENLFLKSTDFVSRFDDLAGEPKTVFCRPPSKSKSGFNACADVEHQKTAEEYFNMCFDACADAYRSIQTKPRYPGQEIYDSSYFVSVVFPNRASKHRFLKSRKMLKMGTVYLSGDVLYRQIA